MLRPSVLVAVITLRAVALQLPAPGLKVLPFSRIATEIHEAEEAMDELSWKVGNSTQEKSSVQWFLATSMKELTNLQKVVMNRTVEGTLGWRYQRCINLTTSKEKTYNQSLTLHQAVDKDDKLAPSMVDARMYELYESQERLADLTMKLGECAAKCPASLLLSRARVAKKAQDSAVPHNREVMKSVAEAIYNTSHEIDTMKDHLRKDDAAKSVLKKLSGMVMEKLLQAKKDVQQMEKDLEVCLHTPLASHLNSAVVESMAANTEVTLEIVKAAEMQARDAKVQVDDLEVKLHACMKRC